MFQGDLNADYAVRVTKFFEMYDKKLAPVSGPDPYFKGYQVTLKMPSQKEVKKQ